MGYTWKHAKLLFSKPIWGTSLKRFNSNTKRSISVNSGCRSVDVHRQVLYVVVIDYRLTQVLTISPASDSFSKGKFPWKFHNGSRYDLKTSISIEGCEWKTLRTGKFGSKRPKMGEIIGTWSWRLSRSDYRRVVEWIVVNGRYLKVVVRWLQFIFEFGLVLYVPWTYYRKIVDNLRRTISD